VRLLLLCLVVLSGCDGGSPENVAQAAKYSRAAMTLCTELGGVADWGIERSETSTEAIVSCRFGLSPERRHGR